MCRAEFIGQIKREENLMELWFLFTEAVGASWDQARENFLNLRFQWFLGYYDGAMFSLIARTGTPIISIDYTLSPEVRYPHQILECERVIHALYEKK